MDVKPYRGEIREGGDGLTKEERDLQEKLALLETRRMERESTARARGADVDEAEDVRTTFMNLDKSKSYKRASSAPRSSSTSGAAAGGSEAKGEPNSIQKEVKDEA